ncbi:MAG TPA: tRNA (adenosine(37)-N6)-dimethylallyltransferase MiaA [Planctomycetota bacterium]|jgi:tRNA dimethylallyltransferase|nr:tRNA (adenosine(37)-N6)-dimethylallyltransferase MiaA [Planctomycetota bacterium]
MPLGGLACGFLIGPTAAGKSRLALGIAARTGVELVSLDSMQVYRGMDVGTAKPSRADRERARHHMLDLVQPNERYDVRRYLEEVAPVLDDVRARGARALFVGGTGFYLKALLSGIFEGPPVDLALRARVEARVREIGSERAHGELSGADPLSAARIHANDTKRLVRALEVLEQTGRPLSAWQREWGWHGSEASPSAPVPMIGLDIETPELDRRIARRTEAMLDAGWTEEAARIRETTGFSPTSAQALGYGEALLLHDGSLDRTQAAQAIAQATRRFARRQRTWYRKFPDVVWLACATESDADAGSMVEAAVRALKL